MPKSFSEQFTASSAVSLICGRVIPAICPHFFSQCHSQGQRNCRCNPRNDPCTVDHLTVAWHSSKIPPLKEKSMHSYRWVAGCCRDSWMARGPWGDLARFPEQVGGHDSQSQSDPLLSLASFVAFQKTPLFMNYQWMGFQLQKTGKDTGKKAERRRGGGHRRGGWRR